jgi:glucose/mannose transport system permease protein
LAAEAASGEDDMTSDVAADDARALAARDALGRRKRRLRGASVAVWAFLLMCAAFVVLPLYVVALTSFKTIDQLALGEIFSWPTPWTVEPWRQAWSEICAGMTCEGISVGFSTSLRILLPSLLLSIGISAVTGYALALWNVRWAGPFLFVLFLCAFVPFQIVMVPLVMLVAQLGIYGTVWGIALVHAVLSMPLLTLMFRNFYKNIPRELINAALLDSGSFWRIFWEIVLPMSKNILVVVAILMVTTVWNDFIVGLTFGGITAQPMTVILANTVLSQFGEVKYNVTMAAALLTAIPPLIIYFALGKFFVQGITAGALKG